MKTIKQILVTICLLAGGQAWGQALPFMCEIDGIYYKIDYRYSVSAADRGRAVARVISHQESGMYYSGDIVIPATITYTGSNRPIVYDVFEISDEAFKDCKNLTSVEIGSNVEYIGNVSFFNSSVETVSFAAGSKLKLIGRSAFQNCAKLTSIHLPEGLQAIDEEVFRDAMTYSKNTSFSIPSTVSYIGYDALPEKHLQDYEHADGMIYINNILYGRAWDTPNTTTLQVQDGPTTIASLKFRNPYQKTKLTSLTLPASVVKIQDLGVNGFDYSAASVSLVLLNPVPPMTITIGLSQIRDEDVIVSAPKRMATFLIFSTLLKTKCTLYVPKGSKAAYETAQNGIWVEAFKEIVELPETGNIEVPTTKGSQVTWQQHEQAKGYRIVVFADATRQTPISIFEFDANGVLKTDTPLPEPSTDAPFSHTITDLQGNTKYFYSIEYLGEGEAVLFSANADFTPSETTIVEKPAPVEINGIYYEFDYRFGDSETNRGAIVARVHPLKNGEHYSGNIVIPATVTYPSGNKIPKIYDVVEIVDRAFMECKNLTSIEIGSNVEFIGEEAFSENEALTSVKFATGSKLKVINSRAFLYCEKLASINLPQGLIYIGEQAFYLAMRLSTGNTSFSIPSTVSYIGHDALPSKHKNDFKQTDGMISVNNILCDRNCVNSEATTLQVLKGTTTLASLKPDWSCPSKLTSITLPASVVNLQKDCFSSAFVEGSNTSTCLILLNPVPPRMIMKGLPEVQRDDVIVAAEGTSLEGFFPSSFKTNCTLYVPKGSKTIYETIENGIWLKSFKEIVEFPATGDIEEPTIEGSQITWQQHEAAKGYRIVVYTDGTRQTPIRILEFDANGVLKTETPVPSTDAPFTHTITDLQSNTYYFYSLEYLGGGGIVLFSTGSYISTLDDPIDTAIDNTPTGQSQIIAYYSITGQRLHEEPESGVYFVMFDNGTSEKRMK